MKRPEITRFDVILIFILLFAVSMVSADVFLLIKYGKELSAPVWTFAGTLTGGEIVAFSLYQISKQVTNAKQTKQKVLGAKHSFLNQLIDEESQDGREQGTTKP